MTTKEYLEKYKKYPSSDNKYEGWEKDLEDIKQFNRDLIDKYPWLKPWNRWTGKTSKDYDYEFTELDDMPEGWRIAFGDQMVEEIHQQLVKYDYVNDYKIVQIKEKWGGLRWYDGGTPIGKLSEDYREVSTSGTPWYPDFDRETEVIREVGRDHYISFYDENVDMTEEERQRYNLNAIYHYRIYKIVEKCTIPDIISKYENMSFNTCIKCGDTAEWESMGWISPYCTKCANYFLDKNYEDYKRMCKDKSECLETLKRGTLETNFTKIEFDSENE